MALGPGKYDDITTMVRELTGAETVAVIIIGGSRGTGFDIQSTTPLPLSILPRVLRDVADSIEKDVAQ